MQDQPLGPRWWLGTDGRWHPPECHPGYPMRGGWAEPPPRQPPEHLPRPGTRDRGGDEVFTLQDRAFLYALSTTFDQLVAEREARRAEGRGEDAGGPVQHPDDLGFDGGDGSGDPEA